MNIHDDSVYMDTPESFRVNPPAAPTTAAASETPPPANSDPATNTRGPKNNSGAKRRCTATPTAAEANRAGFAAKP